MSPKNTRNTYVLDTNILIHDPHAATGFDDAHVRIPIEVVQELDRLKGEQTDRGWAARTAVKSLLKLLGNTPADRQPVNLEGGGTLSILIPPSANDSEPEQKIRKTVKDIGGDCQSTDNKIIAATLRELAVGKKHESAVVLVTKDGAMSLKAGSAGLTVEDYRRDKVTQEEAKLGETPIINIDDHELHQFNTERRLNLMGGRADALSLNEYILLQCKKGTAPARYVGHGVVQQLISSNGFDVKGGQHFRPLNLEQKFLVDALLDPTIELVTVCGQAGTGKTILSLAAGLHMVRNRQYRTMSIMRPVMALGEDIGFLPGGLEDKMAPWIQGYTDAVDAIFAQHPPLAKPQSDRKTQKGKTQRNNGTNTHERIRPIKPFDLLTANGELEVQAMTYIRGRSIPDAILMLDEAQNTNVHQIKTVATRIARNAKLIISGDPSQIDNPYVDYRSNGLVHIRSRMGNCPNIAHVVLRKGERSPLAELAAKLL